MIPVHWRQVVFVVGLFILFLILSLLMAELL